jgi:hypothetical protein
MGIDESLLERRVADWKKSEMAAREAERAASATLESGDHRPLADKAARLRRIAEVIFESLQEDMRVHKHTFTLLDGSFERSSSGSHP